MLSSSQTLVALALVPAALAVPSSSRGAEHVLKFQPDGTFQISIFEDMHYGEAPSSYGPVQDAYTTRVISSVLDAEPKTDLVVFNGDLISRESTFRDNSTHYLDQMLQPLVSRSDPIPWATLYGNHDPGYNRSLHEMLDQERMLAGPQGLLSRTLRSPPGSSSPAGSVSRVGLSNYWLPVYSEKCASRSGCGCTPELIMWFFDSRSGFEFQKLGNGASNTTTNRVDREPWVSEEVVRWFESEKAHVARRWPAPSRKIANATTNAAVAGGAIPSIAFVHIPFHAFAAISNTTALGGGSGSPGPGIDPRRNPGINEMPITPQTYGWCADGSRNTTACPWGRQDVPFMRSLVAETPGLRAVFTAHIHGASWCARWGPDTLPADYPVRPPARGGVDSGGSDAVDICFGQHTGYGGAGDWVRGARQLRLSRKQLSAGAGGGEGRSGLDTWIRLETGDVVGAVSLNSTFGQDEYPVTPVQKTFCQECLDMGRPVYAV
ncbi:Metallo-dependent phosphatase-like protein [Microdochium bolleyi]|uniref:Metallo-dependent phosphatase-like protein n=1 Tax=Microdochium bolleyi TaxID=196109 RepID=A0A136JAL0_9PEZI|nr:Metallo-dependent phosphatase-like protein [Microdochium bolleyi]